MVLSLSSGGFFFFERGGRRERWSDGRANEGKQVEGERGVAKEGE